MLGYKKEFFFGIYEKSDWIVSETYKRCKEFQNIDEFKDELITTVSNSTTEKKILLLKSHPQLTGKISIKNLTKEIFNKNFIKNSSKGSSGGILTRKSLKFLNSL